MTSEGAIARVSNENGVVGCGFLLGYDQVITAAHVVNAALDREKSERARPAPNDVVTVEFPFLDGDPAFETESCAGRVLTRATWQRCNLRSPLPGSSGV